MEAKEILGLDVGLKQTGIARASNVARLAEPLKSVPTDEAIKIISHYVKEHQVETIAVGLPRSLDGQDTDQTAWVRRWIDRAKDKIKAPLYWQDEALTSREAAKHQTSNTKHQSIDEHALAAAIILQDFLDAPETERKLA